MITCAILPEIISVSVAGKLLFLHLLNLLMEKNKPVLINYKLILYRDGRVAIWLNEDLLQGHTESCATFDNKPLSTNSKFECLALEVWGFRF